MGTVRTGGAVTAAIACVLFGAGGAEAQAPRLSGPPGVSDSKVLVIGTDGTRWDTLQRVIAEGRAPNLARLSREGFGVPALLEYAPPEAATLSEVGWSTIASGVWPAKHRVRGVFLNNDPGQAGKSGYHDFLTRLEQERPALSTFLASDWANIGRHENGGPIFSDAIDAKHALAAEDTIESYDRGDEEVTQVSERYLREGSPDAGFVYLGLVDETAHAVGSATPHYPNSIAVTDRRIGRLIAAVRARPRREDWTIIVTTDHGQQHLPFGSVASHGFGTTLERMSFVIASGTRVPRGRTPGSVRVVDVAPAAIHQVGVARDRGWDLDGQSFLGPPASEVASARRGCLAARLRVRARGLAGVRLGARRRSVRRELGPATRRTRRTSRYCVRGGGRVVFAYSRRGRVRVILTTARGHGLRGVARGSSRARLRRRIRGLRRVRGGLLVGTRGRTKRLVFRIRRGRVRYVAVADRGLIRRPARLRRYLRLANRVPR